MDRSVGGHVLRGQDAPAPGGRTRPKLRPQRLRLEHHHLNAPLDETKIRSMFPIVSLLELKQQVTRLSPAERRELNAYLVRLRNESDEGRQALAAKMDDMEAGKKVTMDDLQSRIVTRHGERL